MRKAKHLLPVKPPVARIGLFDNEACPCLEMEAQVQDDSYPVNEHPDFNANGEENQELTPLKDDSIEEELIHLMPLVIDTLTLTGHINSFVKFCRPQQRTFRFITSAFCYLWIYTSSCQIHQQR